MPLRILKLVPDPLPSFRPDVAILFGKYLPRQDVHCNIVGMPSQAELVQQGFASTKRPAFRASRLRREVDYAWLCLKELCAIRKGQCDAVQVRDMVSIGLMALVVAKIKGVPFYYWMSYLMSEGRINDARTQLQRRKTLRSRAVLWKGLIEQWLIYNVLLRAADHVFVQSDRMLAVMAEKGIRADAMTAVPMGVDTELSNNAPAPRRLDGWAGVPVMAYLGAVEHSRQLHTLVDALALVRRDVPTARLLIIGGSSNRQDETRLREYARNLGLEDAMHITGWLPSAEAWSLLMAADLAVSYVPRGELYDVSSPTKLLEYLALGVPAVGNDTPDQEFVLQRSKAGWLTASNAPAIAAAVLDILSDLPAANARAASGPGFIEAQRSYRRLAEVLAERYRHLLSN